MDVRTIAGRDRRVFYYDGGCGLCRSVVAVISRLDIRRRVAWAPYQSLEAPPQGLTWEELAAIGPPGDGTERPPRGLLRLSKTDPSPAPSMAVGPLPVAARRTRTGHGPVSLDRRTSVRHLGVQALHAEESKPAGAGRSLTGTHGEPNATGPSHGGRRLNPGPGPRLLAPGA